MIRKLRNQAKYDEACEALEALGLTPGDFCTMALAVDVVRFVNDQTDEDDEVNLAYVIGAFADDGNAYETLEGELSDAWAMLEEA